MRAELLQIAAELASRRQPFVLAMVVRRQSYSSAHQGDMAIITADGGYHGWLGGNCTQPVVKREAARALTDGQPRLLSLTPEPGADDRPGVTVLPMVCQSGGTVDVYLEPFLPPPRLVLFGLSPVVRALAQLGKGLGYSVEVVDPDAGAHPVPGADRVFVDWNSPELARDGGAPARTFAVVATMGEHDDEAVTTALGLRPAYLGVVASRTRFGQLREGLLGRGISAEPLDRIRNPAGLDIGARLPEEVALSILAEIVQTSRAMVAEPAPPPAPEALDPVCGMTVVVATARHRAEHAGQRFFFCNPRCREKFVAAPERYLTPSAAAR
ncbi:MAG TPA: XdhC family protein [Myxococcaceae bacterium]|nr:XdhC family protein [Myxococcaceae bacterium]